MGPAYEIRYHPDIAKKDLPRISNPDRERIRRAIEAKLTVSPELFGAPLRRTLRGYWKLRVGDYRVIYKVQSKTVLILRIGHRREIYDQES